MKETPPFVPRGTRFHVVIRKGSAELKTVPSSLAQVSPLQLANAPVEKCYTVFVLKNPKNFIPKLNLNCTNPKTKKISHPMTIHI